MFASTVRLCLLAWAIVAGMQQAIAQSDLSDTISDAYSATVTDNLPDGSVSPLASDRIDIWSQPTLTGDWGGLRTRLQDSGVTFAGRSTQFAFGIDGGVNAPPPPPLALGNTFKYTGRGEYDLNLDLEKFGGLPKGTLLVRAEHWYGQYGNVSLNSGSFAPTIFPAATPPGNPNNPGSLYLTNFLYTQPLSQNLIVFAGKKDVLGAADQDIFAGGDGTSQFVNQALIANPSFLLGLPYTSYTAGFVSPQKWGFLKGYVYDPTDRTTQVLQVNDIFSRGIIVGGEVMLNSNLFELAGEHHIGGIWKHHALNNLAFTEPPPGVYPEPVNPGRPLLMNSYTLYYGFDQYLVQFSGSKKSGWGLFGRASISDGNPTPVQYFLSAGIGGDSPIRRDRGDKFGIGWYFVGASNQFGPIPRAVFGPTNGSGVELYYNFQVNPWLNITPDIQFIQPGNRGIAKDSFVYGIRANLVL
ncbi:MAG: carbohydrate porin [Planctomycetes bacterium]|nr:carbohydrate porin [Planctomycetota bacterium]